MDPFSLSVLFSCFRQRDLLMGIFFLSFNKFAYMCMCIKGDYWKKLFSFTWCESQTYKLKGPITDFIDCWWFQFVLGLGWLWVCLNQFGFGWFHLIAVPWKCFSKFHLIVWSLMKPRRVWFLFIMIHVICISSYYVFIIMFSYLNLLISIMMVIVFN